ncbi:MAG: hypothetical protein WCD13_13105, partial [Pseudolabrys sp.]
MEQEERLEKQQIERRDFLSGLGSAIACGAATVAASATAPAATASGAVPAIPNFDWSEHQWAFGVDAEKCIGCLRCVE